MEENKTENKTEEKKVETIKEEVKKEQPKTETKKQDTPKTTNKKVENTKSKVENAKKTSHKNNNSLIVGLGIVAVVIIAIIATIICMKPSPKKAVEDTFNQLKTGAYAQEMLSAMIQGGDNIEAEAQKLFFEKLDWKILNEKEEGELATVEVEVTNKDFKTIMANYMQKALKAALSGNTNQDEMSNYLMEELRNKEILPGLYEAISTFQ